MYKATRDFIAERQKCTEFKLSIPSFVKKIGGGEPNKCFENSLEFVKEGKVNGIKYVCLSGWLVQPFNKEKNSTAIIQHWWNGDNQGNHYDTSPLINDNEEYVLDYALYEFSNLNIEKIKSNVAMSLLYQNGKFELLTNFKTMEFSPIKELRTELLFKYE